MVHGHYQPTAARRGLVLMVVITLLMLFAVVGIAFVVFSQAEAVASRIWRESETAQRPDMDPEMLLSYFLGQVIYGTSNQYSCLRYNSLAENMYGQPGNYVPFNGTGRIHYVANGVDDYYSIDYTKYPTGTTGYTAPIQQPAGVAGSTVSFSQNVPYTYPDFNNPYLGAVRPSDGAVLIPSYYRVGPNGTVSLRPNKNYHPSFPAPEDGVCDVKNLPDSPGLLNANGTITPNDSVWMDIGFPEMKAPDGRKFKPLFAALIQDLDNRVNVNAHGNSMSLKSGGTATPTWCISHQGWSPGEVSLDQVITGKTGTGGPECQYIFNGNNGVSGRYDQTKWTATSGPVLADQYTPGGHFYSCTDIDCWNCLAAPGLVMPTAGTGVMFPWYSSSYFNSWWSGGDKMYNPTSWSYFNPGQNWYLNGGGQYLNNRSFDPRNIEALLRYGDRGSPALRSDLFALCPNSFQNPMTRRQVTTLSTDFSLPGVTPAMYNPNKGTQTPQSPYQLGAVGTPIYSTPPYIFNGPANGFLGYSPPFPNRGGNSPNSGEFGPNWNAMANATPYPTGALPVPLRSRIDLNRGFVDYTPVTNTAPTAATTTSPYWWGFSASLTGTPPTVTVLDTNYTSAMASRQQMALEIFNVLMAVTGTDINDPNAIPGTPQQPATAAQMAAFDALRWLAQLAVNIVDFVSFPTNPVPSGSTTPPAPDDVMTMFNWNPAYATSVNNGWVFGTVLPRLVVNEAYAELVNVPSATNTSPQNYQVNCWVELHNPFAGDGLNTQPSPVPTPPVPAPPVFNGNQAVPTPYYGAARLYYPNTGATSTGGKVYVQPTNGSGGAAGTPLNPTTPGNYAGYRLLIAQTQTPPGLVNNPNLTNNQYFLAANGNVLGVPVGIQCVVDQYTPDPTVTNTLAILQPGSVDLNQVQPAILTQSTANGVVTNTINNCQVGGNQGFYVMGPATALPGTSNLKPANGNPQPFFATLPVLAQASATAANDTTLTQVAVNGTVTNALLNGSTQSSMSYTLPANSNPTAQLTSGSGATAGPGPVCPIFVLQRLACPYLPPSYNPTLANGQVNPAFNPYVTVDFLSNVIINNATQTPAGQVTARRSYGRPQPYGAAGWTAAGPIVPQQANYDATQLNVATVNPATGQPWPVPPTAPAAQQTPMNTFFCVNLQQSATQQAQVNAYPYDWPFFANRKLISPGELLNVSCFAPCQLTQLLSPGYNAAANPNASTFALNTPANKYVHMGPWTAGWASGVGPLGYTGIYRALEFLEGGLRPQWSPIGGRFAGRININTIWDPPTSPNTFMALCDPQPNNFFTTQAVLDAYTKMLYSRTPGGVPGLNDRPFRGLATALAPSPQAVAQGLATLDPQYPNGSDLNDTILRADPLGWGAGSPMAGPAALFYPPKLLFQTNPVQAVPPPITLGPYSVTPTTPEMVPAYSSTGAVQTITNIYPTYELLTKIWNSVTTRSNVFAVWLTVGFFEVLDDTVSPAKLGQEIGRSENRQVRHRMFAVVDRSQLGPNAVPAASAVTQAQLAQQAQGVPVTVYLPNTSSQNGYGYWGGPMSCICDTGPNQETVTLSPINGVRATSAGTSSAYSWLCYQFTGTFKYTHPMGFPITGSWSAPTCNPGPQPMFNAQSGGIVPWANIIE